MSNVLLEARQLREGALQNVLAGFTVAVVALPLALAFGRTAFGDVHGPAAGLWAAILAGFLAALFGGSPHAITGPTGVLAVFTAHLVLSKGGFDSPDALAFGFLAVVLSGVFQIFLGLARMGRVIEFIPYPVITGFMSGIALIIVWTGVKDAVNPGATPLTDDLGFEALANFVAGAAPSHVGVTVLLTLLAVAFAFGWPRLARNLPGGRVADVARLVPGSLLALAVVSVAAILLPQAGSVARLHPLPEGGPVLFTDFNVLARHPDWAGDLVSGALGLALISSIDTLLTCVIADSVTGRRTQSNRELLAQGVGNAVAGLFSAAQSCGAAVRTMVNVKNGGRTRLSGMSHAAFLLLILLVGASAVTLVPVAALAGILVVTGLGMVEWHAIVTAHRAPKSDTLVMLATLVLTVTVGLVEAVLVGVVLAALLFIKRMAEFGNLVEEGHAELTGAEPGLANEILVYEIRGPLFFGAANRFSQSLERSPIRGRAAVFKMRAVTATDETGMRTFDIMVDRFSRLGVAVIVVGLPPKPFAQFDRFGLVEKIGRDHFVGTDLEATALALRFAGTPR